MANKKVKKKLNIKGLFVILLTLYLIIMLIYYIFTMPIKTIIINGNKILKDADILRTAELNDYPSLFGTRTTRIKKKIKSLDLINDVKIKKNINGTLTINVEEEKVLFFNKVNNKYVLSNQKEVEIDKDILGIPTLVNYTPTDIYENLNNKLSKIDSDIISLISEIEYSPDIKDDITIDGNRFILRMNDGNRIYINIANFEKLKEYKRLFSTIAEDEKGSFYLDGSRKTVLFRTYEAEEKEEIEAEGEENELPE